MRDHIFIRHPTSESLVRASDISHKKRKLRSVRKEGMWAFVLIPPDSSDEPCEVNYWHRANKDPLDVALMLGHELGHIGDGGPKDELGYWGEENRADEFGYAAEGAVYALLRSGVLTRPAAVQRRRGPPARGRSATGRRAASSAGRGRSSRRRARQGRRR